MMSRTQRVPDWHAQFLAMLPTIRRYARLAFRNQDPESRDELVQEVVASACLAIARLHERGKANLAYPIVLARFGVCHALAGRRVGTPLNGNDVLSVYSQRKHGHSIKRLDHFDHQEVCWKEVLVEDRRSGPAETAAARIDVGDWLNSLPQRNRQIAQVLATGESTNGAANQFGISAGRVSQLRGELRDDWERFQREPACCGS